jgi:protein-tyrosine phosphatase
MTWPSARARHGGIDEIPLPGVAGRLWLCGKHAVGPDHEVALAEVQATTIVCLTQVAELDERYPDYLAWLRSEPEHAIWHPIHDLHAPPLAVADELVEAIVARLAAGERIILHCAAGIGRSGTIAVCVLVELGVELEEALAIVAANRPMAGPEVGSQRELVVEFAALRPRAARPPA